MAVPSGSRHSGEPIANGTGKCVQSCTRPQYPLLRSSRSLLLIIALLTASLHPSQAARNVTVDDDDPAIKYSGDEWKRVIVEPPSAPTFGGSWMSAWPKSTFIGRNSSYQMNFEFSGTALYLYYPLWPFPVSSGEISVDGSEPVVLSLQDLSRAQVPLMEVSEGDPPSSLSRIRYSVEGLQPGPHKLVISPDDSVPFAASDALMYTDDRLDPDVIYDWHTQLSPEPATSITSSPPPSPTTSNVPLAQNNNKVAVIAASVGAAVAALCAVIFILVCRKRHQRRKGQSVQELGGVHLESKAHMHGAQGTPPQPSSYHDGSYGGLGTLSPISSPSSSPFAATHHIPRSSETLLLLQSETDSTKRQHIPQRERGNQNVLRVRNDMHSFVDVLDDHAAPPAYEMLPQTPPPDILEKPVTLRYPGSEDPSASMAASSMGQSGSSRSGHCGSKQVETVV